jgi:hypothetical protein
MSRLPFDPDCGLDIASTTIRQLDQIATIQYYGYRVVQHPEGTYFVHEAYYDHDEALLGIASEPAHVCADTLDDLNAVHRAMADGLREPILSLADHLPQED